LGFAGVLLALLTLATPARSQPAADFGAWLAAVKAEAVAGGIRVETVEQALSGVVPIDRVLELDRRQPEFSMSFAQYMTQVVTPRRIKDGRQLWARHRALLAAVSRRYGVPAPLVVALWGIESGYGRSVGSFPVVPALATLAFDGRRSRYFRGELINALKMVDAGVPAARMQGSWAGAMGQCQFMPSTYLAYGQHWDGDGPADIWATPADVFASAANYLARSGWNGDNGWGRPVRLPRHGMAAVLFGLDNARSLADWRRLGVRQADGRPLRGPADLRAALVRAETGKGDDVGRGTPYLVTDNFRALMTWNRSVLFAIAAGTLADRIASQPPTAQAKGPHVRSRANREGALAHPSGSR
jgi:membrane-bound lytic murein transglycosylase B